MDDLHVREINIIDDLTDEQKYHVYNIIASWHALKRELKVEQGEAVSRFIKQQTKDKPGAR